MPRPFTRQQLAELAWMRMQDFVLSEDRNQELRDALGLGRGTGRVKTLLGLEAGPRPLGELAEETGVDAPYATLIVNELEARGLVTRTSDPEDRRRRLVALTRAGEAAVATAREVIDRPPVRLERLSKAELAELTKALGRLEDP